MVDGGVRVSVLARGLDKATVEAIEKAGMKVEARVASAKFVVGVAPRERLAGLALLKDVRRVEPTGTR